MLAFGLVVSVEMTYRLSGEAGKPVALLGAQWDPRAGASWGSALGILLVGAAVSALACRRARVLWDEAEHAAETRALAR